ncbi:MAG TPA: tetratricopeptide repeat protein, partial [Candidatus Obscuribacterales bacterium]
LVVRARGIMERKYGAEDSHLKPYLEAEAVVELYTGHLKESQKLYEKALQLSIKQDKGHPHFGTRKLLMKLADVHERQGNLAEAEKMLRKKLQLEEIAHGKEHHKVRDALIDLGNLLLKEKKYKPSEEALLRALNMFEQQGDDDPRVELKVMASYAELLRKSGRTGEAARQETKVKHLKEQLVRDFGALPEEKKELEGEVFDAE